MTCNRCGKPIIYDGDWPACPCDDEPRLALTIHEAASYMCVSRSKVMDLIATGMLGFNRATRPMTIPMISVKAHWAAAHHAWRLRQDIYRLDRTRR
jgi:excisionase family DNA binding protein